MPEFYELQINGSAHDVHDAWLGESLLYVLRERLGFTGTKSACEEGECGSCSVLVDDVLVCACLALAGSATGKTVTTVEGLAATGTPSDVQQAFVTAGAVQCGFCTPGLIVAAHALLTESPEATGQEIREALSGNVCRCTGYGRILEAVAAAARARLAAGAGSTDDRGET